MVENHAWRSYRKENLVKQAVVEKEEVEVGKYLADGTFTGHLVLFTGEWVGYYAAPGDEAAVTVTHTLFRCPMLAGSEEVGYRVHVVDWRRNRGEESEAWLEPCGPDSSPFTEEEARHAFPELFAAVDMPNIVELD